jgi:hypothetical protein
MNEQITMDFLMIVSEPYFQKPLFNHVLLGFSLNMYFKELFNLVFVHLKFVSLLIIT